GFLGLRGENLLGDPVTVHCRREPAIDRDLPQDGCKFIRREPIAEGPAEMGLEFMHPAKAGDHAEVEDAALARLESIVTPNRAPTIGREQFLKLPIEIV